MSNELFWLLLTILVTALFWVPYIINRILEHGLIAALRNPNRDSRPKSQWASRMMYAHENAVENLIIFAPLVLMVEYLQLNNQLTAIACAVYFFIRIAHYFIYSFGVPYLRTIAFFVGFLVQMFMGLTLIQSL